MSLVKILNFHLAKRSKDLVYLKNKYYYSKNKCYFTVWDLSWQYETSALLVKLKVHELP